MRLDLYLVKHHNLSRTKAAALIQSNSVFVNGQCISKNSYDVDFNDKIDILNSPLSRYVSRGGLKLEKAIEVFQLDFTDKVICDIGSSTGGFTDCALKHHARFVYSIDVGSNQMHESLRHDYRIELHENLNFKDVTSNLFTKKIDYFVCDVSFISIRIILEKLKDLFTDFSIILLFKPQFEVGPNKLNKKGVVHHKEDLIDALNSFQYFLHFKGLYVENCTYSPILGQKEGNIEFLFSITTKENHKSFDYSKQVEDAIKSLKVKTC